MKKEGSGMKGLTKLIAGLAVLGKFDIHKLNKFFTNLLNSYTT